MTTKKKYEVSDKDAEMEFENIVGEFEQELQGVKCSPKAYRAGLRFALGRVEDMVEASKSDDDYDPATED